MSDALITLAAGATDGSNGTILLIASVITAVAAAGGGVYSARQSRQVAMRQTRLEETKVESAAYEQAQLINSQTFQRMQAEIERISAARKADAEECSAKIRELEDQIAALRKALNEEHANSGRLELELAHLDRIVSALKKVIEDADLPMPQIALPKEPPAGN